MIPKLRENAGAWIAVGVFLILAVGRNTGVLGFIMAHPSAASPGSAAAAFLTAALSMAAVAACLGLLALAGRRVVGWLGSEADAACGLALGMGLAGTALLPAGLFIGFSPMVWVTLCAAFLCLAGLGWMGRRPSRTDDRFPERDVPSLAEGTFMGVLAGVLAFCAWHVLVCGLSPPTGWDVLAYHLALPKLYLRAGRILAVPWMIHSHWPHLMELLYAAPLALGLDSLSGLFHAAVCGVWVLSVHSWARQSLGNRAAFLGAALIVCQPVFLRLAPMAHSDGGQALFYFLSAAAVWRWAEKDEASRLVLAGLLGGLAAACKLTGLALAGSLALWIALASPRPALQRLKASLTYLLAAAVFCSPWYGRALWATGDPFWPFLDAWTGGPAREMAAAYEASAFWSFPRDLGLLLNNGPQFLIVPFTGLCGAALLAGKRLPREPRFLLACALPYLLVISRQQEAWRFAMACFPALALSAGWAADRLLSQGSWRRWAAVCLLCFGLFPALSLTQNNELFPVLGLRSSLTPELPPSQAYLHRTLDHYSFFKKASSALPPGSRTLLFREIRGYYLDADYLWGDPVNQNLIAYRGLDPDSLRRRLSELGVTHVLVNEGVGMYREREGYYDRRVMAVMDSVLAGFGSPVLKERGLSLWRLETAKKAPPVKKARKESRKAGA